MTKRLRVVWLTPTKASPLEGAGGVHLFELLKLAAREHDVHLITAEVAGGVKDPDLDEIGITYENVSWRPLPEPRNRLAYLWRLAARDPSSLLFQPDRTAALKNALIRAEVERKPDLVQVALGEAAPVLAAARAPSALLLFDAYTRQLHRERQLTDGWRGRAAWGLMHRRIDRWERRWYAKADAIACVSAVDASHLSTMLARPVAVIPNPVGPQFFVSPALARSHNIVTFVAHLNYRPNVEAVRWLTDKIWPLVIETHPDAKLRIVGYNPADEVLWAAERAGAELHANVEDVRPFYWEAAVSLAPIRLGSGLRNKILHAMACRAPVVATRIAVEGLAVEHDRDLLLADDAGAIASAIKRVLDDPDSARERSDRAHRVALGYRSDTIGQALDEWWTSIVSARSRAD